MRAPDAGAGFAITRAVLRRLLGQRVGVSPHALRFSYGRHGKPFVAQHPEVAFNVSHTRGRAVLAFAPEGCVGVDVERLDPRIDVEALADRCFSPAEAAALRRVAAERRVRAFFDGWARKEAFVKALGAGLSHDLTSFTVALTPGEPVVLMSPHCWGAVDRLLGVLAGAVGRHDDAEQHLGTALELHLALGAGPLAARTRGDQARLAARLAAGT